VLEEIESNVDASDSCMADVTIERVPYFCCGSIVDRRDANGTSLTRLTPTLSLVRDTLDVAAALDAAAAEAVAAALDAAAAEAVAAALDATAAEAVAAALDATAAEAVAAALDATAAEAVAAALDADGIACTAAAVGAWAGLFKWRRLAFLMS
jgi:hypothetical protein